MMKKNKVSNGQNNNTNFNNDGKNKEFEIRQKFELTDIQKDILELGLHRNTRMILLDGCAGVSKTYIAVLIGLILLQEKKSQCLTYVRTTIQSKDGETGFLAGSLEEKTAWMNEPFFSKLEEFLMKPAIEKLNKENKLKTLPSSMIRGLNVNGVCIMDECQNALFSSLESMMTRMAEHSLLILCGDSSGSQNDLGAKTGFKKLTTLFQDNESKENGIYYFKLGSESVVRSKFVKFIIKRLEQIHNKEVKDEGQMFLPKT